MPPGVCGPLSHPLANSGRLPVDCYLEVAMKIFDPKTQSWRIRKLRRRYNDPGDAHELTFSCFRRYQFLARDRTRNWFIEALEAAREKWGFHLWAYVLMPEHVHLLIHAPIWIPRITVREGKRVRRRFWQPGGGYDRNSCDPSTAHSMIEYFHANPIRRNLVARAEDWEWSSARWYAGIRPVPIEMDATLPGQ